MADRMMKAALLRAPGKIEVAEMPVPKPAADEVLIKVRACGICGSDLRYFHGDNPWAKHTLGIEKPNPPNMILGHEFAGEVEGSSERAVILAFKACGCCDYCRRGDHHLCQFTKHIGHSAGWEGKEFNPGGYAEYCPIWKDATYPLPDSISFEEATFLDGLGVAVHAVRKAEIELGDEVAILGSGPIGLSIMQTAKAFGVKKAIVTDIYKKPLAIAQQLRAEVAINASEEDVVAKVKKETKGEGVRAVFNTVGTAESIVQALKLLQRGGKVVLIAGTAKDFTIDFDLLSGERSLTTSVNFHYPDFQTAIDLMASGKIEVKPLVTHRFHLSEIEKAFEVITDKRKYEALKVVIHF